jgi:hypothetical protein
VERTGTSFPMERIGTFCRFERGGLLSFIGGAFATGGGERQDQNPSLLSRRSIVVR